MARSFPDGWAVLLLGQAKSADYFPDFFSSFRTSFNDALSGRPSLSFSVLRVASDLTSPSAKPGYFFRSVLIFVLSCFLSRSPDDIFVHLRFLASFCTFLQFFQHSVGALASRLDCFAEALQVSVPIVHWKFHVVRDVRRRTRPPVRFAILILQVVNANS